MIKKLVMVATVSSFLLFGLFLAGFDIQRAETQSEIANPDLGYGFNVAAWDIGKVQELGFNWVKVFNIPDSRLAANVMIRIDVDSSDVGNLSSVRTRMRDAAQNKGDYIDAYEIGNEVNLDAEYGWKTAPEAEKYAEVLCAAYDEIKTYDPTAIVISAGLAPTGRVTGTWNGHAGHNGLYQDDHEFLREMLDAVSAKSADCFDAVGYHNYGFDQPYDASPDCVNGFCFRGVEKIRDIMVEKGLSEKQVWTTEFGWMVDPDEVDKADCRQTLVDQGRAWQLVSLQSQADNIAGAYDYAAKNWPWMGGLILFNLNFNKAGYYERCEQMTFYSVQDRPAETALKNLKKAYEYVIPKPVPIITQDGKWSALILHSDQPYTMISGLTISNTGDAPFTYTVSISNTGQLTPTVLGNLSAVVSNGISETVQFTMTASGLITGTYLAQVTVAVDPVVDGYPKIYEMKLTVADKIYPIYLPFITSAP
ncbi:MAG: hypothetical protein ACI9EW_001854 [Cellvibrionaceae bacterium]|jgi:hypothetical protein